MDPSEESEKSELIINGYKYPYDPVSCTYVGWWLTGEYAYVRNGMGEEYLRYRKLPRVTTYEQVLNIFDNTDWKTAFHGRMVYTFSDELRNDPRVLIMSQREHATWCICIMGDQIQRDPQMAKFVMMCDPTNIRYLRKEHLDNEEVMMVVAKHKHGNMIREASKRIRNNVTIARAGLSGHTSLCVWGNEIKDNEEMVKLALKKNKKDLIYASPRLREKYKPYVFSDFIPRVFKNIWYTFGNKTVET